MHLGEHYACAPKEGGASFFRGAPKMGAPPLLGRRKNRGPSFWGTKNKGAPSLFPDTREKVSIGVVEELKN